MRSTFLSIHDLFGERRIGPPLGFSQGGAATDSPDMEDPGSDLAEAGSLLGVRLAIIYEDAKGDETRRFITVQKAIRGNGVWFLQAYCELRHALRTFRFDRIREIIDT